VCGHKDWKMWELMGTYNREGSSETTERPGGTTADLHNTVRNTFLVEDLR